LSTITRTWKLAILIFAIILPTNARAESVPSIVVRNNHDLPYSGPVTFRTSLPDGFYRGSGAQAEVSGGTARAVVNLPAESQAKLEKRGSAWSRPLSPGPFSIRPEVVLKRTVRLLRDREEVGRLDFGLAVIPGRDAGPADAVTSFKPLDLKLTRKGPGVLAGKCWSSGYEIEITLTSYGGGWMDVDASLTRVEDGPDSAYVALVRRVTMPGVEGVRMRWNGREMDGTAEPAQYDRVFILTHGVDWCAWKLGNLSFAAVNKFTPGFTYEHSTGRWYNANYFYAQERARREGDSLYLISEIAGPNPEQEKVRYLGVRAYTPPLKGETVRLGWRLAVAMSPQPEWQESQLRAYAGYRNVTESGDTATVDLGVPWVEFGTSYFPYSTMCENFDFYRTADLDRESWWPFSPRMWEDWRAYVPQMKTDLRIIRAMGFEWVRLHHLELLGDMDRKNAIAFLDFYMDECRKLGLKVLVDTAGSPEWMKLIAGRYKDAVKMVELENEILIGGIRPGDAERWTSCYRAIKEIAPDTQVFLTGSCNQGMFERLVRLGVPFDRVGFHNYKHGPAWKETNSSIALGLAGHGDALERPSVLGEFNWKKLTEFSPEARAKEFAEIYGKMLEPRAIPHFFQFHWQETLSVNPRLTRQGIRHYETIHLDRRPKPEAVELMELIRQYCRKDSPVRELRILIMNAQFENGRGHAGFLIENNTNRTLNVKITPECFSGIQFEVVYGDAAPLRPGEQLKRRLELKLDPGAPPGVYHYFLRVDYSGNTAYGWGIASNPGKPQFDKDSVLPDLVEYPQGASVVESLDFRRATCVAFGKGAPVIEMEMAYQVFNTLQSATGREMRLCSTADIPESFMKHGNLILVGTAATNPLIAQSSPKVAAGRGTILLHDAGDDRQWLLLTGDGPDAVRAAATDFVLRYWQNAKDSTIRVSGMEKGAALGDRAVLGEVDLP